MGFHNLKTNLEDGIYSIVIDREEKANALNAQTMQDIEGAFQEVYDNPEIKGVLITGAGNKAFVAGADIKEISEINYMTGRKFAESGQEIFAKIENCPKPVIAAINGYALGGGCELALACHIRVASENAQIGLPEVSLGLIPGYGGTQRLPQLIGKGKAFEMIMTGDPVGAKEAQSLGLVNHVVEQAELIKKAETILRRIIARAPLAVSMVIDCVNASQTTDDGYQTEANSFGNCCKSEDFVEGTKAFLNKRKPVFQGK
ncbi:enoyl-CoA hydratase-related protein [Rapidithrix thailandica]|uniref:Enoyl-CoA hydratase-related protein n=1 Tax=Rapidithrix thailandica TaxID=413964 RepID=A0AAW9SH65_9BACT